MNQPNSYKKFIFIDKFDSEFLFSLYENDYGYIAEMFQNALEYFDNDADQIKTAYEKRDIDLFKKAVHKIKPVFGFTGLIKMQETITNLEESITKLPIEDVGKELETIYHSLLTVISKGKQTIETEKKRLLEYNHLHV